MANNAIAEYGKINVADLLLSVDLLIMFPNILIDREGKKAITNDEGDVISYE